MHILKDCEPSLVFSYFEQLSQIPRSSGNEKAVSDFVVAFAKARHLFVYQDELFNVVIKKEGSKGYENAPPVILQAHLDMVCEKNKITQHDFDKDPLHLYIEGDFIRAKGTTLGADNGIAVAMAMAVLDSDICCPPLEVVFTTQEETGLFGAAHLDESLLTAKQMINIDTEEEGIFVTSCAGGSKPTLTLPITWEAAPEHCLSFCISILGLKGGHSGMDIALMRGNANRLLARVLQDISTHLGVSLCSFCGGAKDNAIPREAEMVIWVDPLRKEELFETVAIWQETFQNELRVSDKHVQVCITPFETNTQTNIENQQVFSKETCQKLVTALLTLPNGVLHMSQDFPHLVETSNNIGVVQTTKEHVKITCAARSSVVSRKAMVVRQAEAVAQAISATLSNKGEYPAWEYAPESTLRKVFCQTYLAMYNKEAKLDAIHAGLECGWFAEKISGIDMISFGPDMFDVHTPDERLSICSVKRSWEFLLQVLGNLARHSI